MSFDWKATIGVVAPTVATALGGPLAGLATTVLCDFFGLGDGATEADIEKAVRGMTPETLVKLKTVEADFKAKMVQAQVDMQKIAMEDRHSARQMAIGIGGGIQACILIVTMVIFSGCLVALFLGHLEDLGAASQTIINYAIGQVSGWAQAAVAFYFGTTINSKDKDATIRNLSVE